MVKESEASQRNDVSFTDKGEPVTSIQHFHELLTQLVGRARITDRPEQYESVALLVIECSTDGPKIYSEYPPKDSPVHVSKFFERLYRVYDERYCYVGADRAFCRKFWVIANDPETKAVLKETTAMPEESGLLARVLEPLIGTQDRDTFAYKLRLWSR